MRMLEDEIKHAGILGMHWGVRKAISNVRTSIRNKQATSLAKDEKKAVARREQTKNEVEGLMSFYKGYYAKKGKPFNEKLIRSQTEKTFARDLNTSVKDIRRERVIRGTLIATSALTVIGHLAMNVYLNKRRDALVKQAGNMFKPKVINL